MSAMTQTQVRKLSGAAKEQIFSAFYHGNDLSVEIDGAKAKAKVLQVRGAMKPETYEIVFHVAHGCGNKETVTVPEYVADGSGGMIRQTPSRVRHSSR